MTPIARGSLKAVVTMLTGIVFAVTAPPVSAQAWVAPAKVGAVTVLYQTIDNTGHRSHDGTVFPGGYDSVSRAFLLNFDYAVTDRFSFAVDLPYVGSKYIGPEPSFFGLPVDECFCWNHGFQDIGVTGR